MPDMLNQYEIIFRGIAIGINAIIAALVFVGPASRVRRWLAMLFLIGINIYLLLSAPDGYDFFGPVEPVAKSIAVFNSVFFWWFALSLFDDNFRWSRWKLAPFISIFILHLPISILSHGPGLVFENVVHSAISLALMAHAVLIAITDRNDDLVDPRRRFRLHFAFGVGVLGVVTVVGELIENLHALPAGAGFIHALTIAIFSLYFGGWMLSANQSLFAPLKPQTIDRTPRAASPAYSRLTELMDAGAYREEGLTIAGLASKVDLPEHQLRQLINGELGYRNFSSFLNDRRIADAEEKLRDPENTRKQVIQIALELGYASIAPFNRAFKAKTGKTPTQYRRDAAGDG